MSLLLPLSYHDHYDLVMEPPTPRPDTRLYRPLQSDDLDRCKADLTEVSLDEFIEIFIPKLLESLEVTAEQITKTQAWHDFFPPLRVKGKEDTVFKRLIPIFKKMVSKARI